LTIISSVTHEYYKFPYKQTAKQKKHVRIIVFSKILIACTSLLPFLWQNLCFQE
jgi:hypothetical protein